MPATHHSSSAPSTPSPQPAAGTPPPAAANSTSLGRIPVLDVRPMVHQGRRPAKAVVGETFEVTATVFREGHEAVAAHVDLT
ncbi:maltotransferase domain-containing protein, partial [Streptomyces sp. NPDC127091]|uniref:maltotransferase domain-containing protein n=1 Tax=Streptomyces sp. NPDC127091 TaxID=3347134 RepID=UPI003657E8BF